MSESTTRASVKIIKNKPNQPTVSSEQAFIAANANNRYQATEEVRNADGVGSATHSRPGTTVMYKPSERSGYVARTVSVSAIQMLYAQGWADICPACHDHHVDRNGDITTDPNACSAREPVAVRVCSVCRKRIFDNMEIKDALMADEDDPNVIVDEAYQATDAAARTKQKMDLHLWVRHPEWAQANGVPPLPAAFREMVDTGFSARGT